MDPGDAIVNCPPTFGMYAFDAAVNDARVITVPRKVNFGLDVPGIKEAVLQKKPKVNIRLSAAQALPNDCALLGLTRVQSTSAQLIQSFLCL